MNFRKEYVGLLSRMKMKVYNEKDFRLAAREVNFKILMSETEITINYKDITLIVNFTHASLSNLRYLSFLYIGFFMIEKNK